MQRTASADRTGFAGVHGVPDPTDALLRLGVTPVWSDGCVAFGGAPVHLDGSEQVVLCGEVTLDNAAVLRRSLGCHPAEDGALLAELYARRRIAGMSEALGMFALAVWDQRERRLVLLRDGTGARTLYYAGDGRNGWWFASRLRTLRRSPAVSGALSLPALRHYLICAFVPGEATLWREARELRPGTALSLPEGSVTSVWEPEEAEPEQALSLDDHAMRLRPLLEDAVAARLPAEGPVAIYLSGGLDSGLVTALASRAAPGPVHTFAIHFGERYPNELAYSGLVAAHCSTRHHVLELTARLIQRSLPETMAALDDPIGDPLTVPNLLLGRAAAEVAPAVLNGEGGDPCFGGPKNSPMLLHELYGSGVSRKAAYLRSFQKCYDDLPRLLTVDVQGALAREPAPETLLDPFFDGTAMRRYVHQLLHVNVRIKGADQILTKVNNLTTANGLLGRSPLFDRRIVAASFAMPPEAKLDGAVEKAVLKRAVADLLPGAIIARPKSGMLVPVQRWFQDELRRYAKTRLLGRDAHIRPYLNQSLIREWLDYRGVLWPRHGVKLWLVLALEEWLRVNER